MAKHNRVFTVNAPTIPSRDQAVRTQNSKNRAKKDKDINDLASVAAAFTLFAAFVDALPSIPSPTGGRHMLATPAGDDENTALQNFG